MFTEGTTDADGLIKNAFLSTYTLGSPPGNDVENPHRTEVELNGYSRIFKVDPRDLDKDQILKLVVDTKGPEPGGGGFLPNLIILLIIDIAAIVIALWYHGRH